MPAYGAHGVAVKFARINSTDQETAVVAAVTGKKICVLSYVITPRTRLRSNGFGRRGRVRDAALGTDEPDRGTPVEAAYNRFGHFETVAGEAVSPLHLQGQRR